MASDSARSRFSTNETARSPPKISADSSNWHRTPRSRSKTRNNLSELLERHEKLVEQAAQDTLLVGESPAIQAVRATARRIADTDLAVLILGENGTGKEVVARAIHFGSRRRKHPFIAVNCAALTETLLESELFGHEKGAFTDAHEARAGKFELASGGTLFLDEIGDMSLAGQSKLLRVLEDKTIVRVGGSRPIHTDVRVLAATNQKLAELVRAKRFREDLYFRLNVVSLELPPLRERGDDVMLLAEHFLQQFCKRAGRRVPKFTAAARKRLESHTWPGNVRELRNLMERLAYLSSRRPDRSRGPGVHSLAGGRRRRRSSALAASSTMPRRNFSASTSSKRSTPPAATSARPPKAWACTARICTARCGSLGMETDEE